MLLWAGCPHWLTTVACNGCCQLGAQVGLLTGHLHCDLIMCLGVLVQEQQAPKSIPRAVPKPQVKPVKTAQLSYRSPRASLCRILASLSTAQIQSEEK